jgi:hypothetical protein
MPPYAFWYIYATNGADGFLLDLVRRPDEARARLAVYHEGAAPRIVRRGFPLAYLDGAPGKLGVRLDGIALDAAGCRGALADLRLDARFRLSGRGMAFVPTWVAWWFSKAPDFRSQYGALDGAVCEGVSYGEAPLVCSTYAVEDLARAKWLLISAMRFGGTDLALEISAARLLGMWLPTAWVFFEGRERHLNSGIDSLFRVRFHRAGEIEGGERVFTASVRAGRLKLDIEARAPLSQFARLEAEGKTEIHTTLFGTCRVTAAGGRKFTAERTCLLEVKN